MTDLTSAAWQDQIATDSEAVIIDVRTDDEVSEGIIPNALHIDIYKGAGFLEEVQKLDSSKNYYVYCRSGGRSAQACAVMESVGIASTFNLIGGITAWDGEVTS